MIELDLIRRRCAYIGLIVLCLGSPDSIWGADVTFSNRIPDVTDPWPTWIEGKNGAILMAYAGEHGSRDSRVRIAESIDGGHTWTIVNYVDTTAGYAYMSRLRDGRLVMVVYKDRTRPLGGHEVGWIASSDEGRSWSEPTRIPLDVRYAYAYGPIVEVANGDWAYCFSMAKYEHLPIGPLLDGDAYLIWSDNQGKQWGEPIKISDGTDGNRGMGEMAIAQIEPNVYVAAIRSDESPGGWDGFYLARSTNGVDWSVPKSLADIGRMPLFYQIGQLWVLAYRQYVPADDTAYSTYRVSKDGITWSAPQRIESGVNNAPFFVIAGSKEVIAFNHGYPDRARITRNVIRLNEPR